MSAPRGRATRMASDQGGIEPSRAAGGPGSGIWSSIAASGRKPRQIIITPSAQASIELIARVLLDAGDIAWLESPGYGGARAALEAAGADVVGGTRLDRSGLALRAGRGPAAADLRHAVASIPDRPSDADPPPAGVARLSRKATGAALIEDDYDSEFHYDGTAGRGPAGPRRRRQRVLCRHVLESRCSPTSASVTASCRRIWWRCSRSAQRHSGQIALARPLQDALAEFIDDGHFAAHIRKMTPHLSRHGATGWCRRSAAETRRCLRDRRRRRAACSFWSHCRRRQNDRRCAQRLAEAGVMARPLSVTLYRRGRRAGAVPRLCGVDRRGNRRWRSRDRTRLRPRGQGS